MAHHSLEQLKILSDKIQDEEMSLIIKQMANAFLDDKNEQTETVDPRKQTEHEKCVSLLLRSMRVHLCLDLIRQGHASCMADFRKDWDEILDCMKFMECTWNVTNELLSDAVDVVLLLDPGKRSDLLRLLDFSTRLKIKKRKPLRFPVADCAFQMAEYCLETSRAQEFFAIITNLISLSEERNAGDLNKHRSIVSHCLYYTVDYDQPLTIQICEAQRQYFEGVCSKSACRFYWFYAFALMKLDRTTESMQFFKLCRHLCMEVEGETSWTGAKAGSFYHCHQLFTEPSPESAAYLWDLLKKIDSGFYQHMDPTVDFISARTRALLLKFHLNQQSLQGLLPEIERFRDYCVSVEETNLNPLTTVRHAENTLAAYYLERGDYLQAAEHSLKALHSIPANNLPADPSDILIYSNLLLIYTQLNDADQALYYMQKLIDMADDYEDDASVMSRIPLLISTAERKFNFQINELEDDRQYLYDIYQEIFCGEAEPAQLAPEDVPYAYMILDLCSKILDSFTADHDELLRYRKIINHFIDHPEIYQFNDPQKCVCYTLLTQVEWQLGSPTALQYLDKCLQYVDSISESREARISTLRFAAIAYYAYDRKDRSIAMANEVFSGITAAWQKATAYLNDQRVCQVLSFIKLHFNICYAVLRASVTPAALYERVLQFKDLPALVGRERNRLLRLAPVDENLKQQIFAMQDRLAAAELNDSLKGTDSARQIAAQLEHLESQFAAQFPRNLYFTEITYDRVCKKLPDNSAIVEYFFSLNETSLSGTPCESDAWELDIFITAKRNGIPRLDHIKVPRGDIIIDQAARFVGALLDPDDLSAEGEKPILRADLYRKLIAPVLPFLEGISNLYIAPDDQLCNLPFEILYDGKSGLLQDRFKVCRLVSGRDLLFYDDRGPTGEGCFILGDPNYESERGEITHSKIRGSQMSLEPVEALPFSHIEAARIGRRCHSGVCTGDAATKYALQDSLPCGIIHLATHGVFDENLETDSLYSSHLVFAGYNKWVSNKTESRYCGNGVLTADEISRMDLKKTELVVLSACQSGLGDTSYGSVRGLLSAFSAAGARWVISHLWHASDLSTPILMDAFYDAWLNRGKDIPDALQYAKNYLKTVTIGTLRRDGWLSLPKDARIPEDYIAWINETNCSPDDVRPFEDEYFWGGFTVHRTR